VNLTGHENVTRTITTAELLANATDVDLATDLRVTNLVASAGRLLDNGDGSWDWIPPLNNTAPITLSYQVSDGIASTMASANLALTADYPLVVIEGTERSDVLKGTAANDYINGRGGNDAIQAGAGKDLLIGAAGNDRVEGQQGDDHIFATGGDGNDIIDGGLGIDTYDLSWTNAPAYANLSSGLALSAETGSDRLYGIEQLIGSRGDDRLIGDGRDNLLIGMNGNDVLDGGLGNDTFLYSALGHSLLSGFDVITDFQIGSDVLDGPNTVSSANVKKPSTAVSTLSASSIAAVLTAANLPANGAAIFTMGTTSIRTFVVLNDSVAGFSASTDALIEITGYTGSLSSFAVS